ncbi:hypothetical protein HK100_011278 [Physocladia obscura]|uniref:Uncharacterized protein n=1 Tax=Physocladia obscura TaxID=109957 RepID=A0AAD5T3C4_9FUNG|nr:hypothetical protein HK100_011278 [Physocladia obscura]
MKRATAKAVGSGRVVRVDSGKKDGLRESKWKSSESTLGTAKDGSQLMAETNYNAYPATESRHHYGQLDCAPEVTRTINTENEDSWQGEQGVAVPTPPRQLRRISKRLSDFNYVSTTSAKTSNSFVNTLNGNTVWLAAFDDPNLLYVNNLQRTKENQTTYNVVQTLHLKETAVSMELEVESSDVLVPSSPSDDVDTESPIERAASTMGDIDTLYDIDDVAVDGNDDSNNDNTGDLGLALEFNTRNPPLVSSSFDDGNVVHVGRWLRFFDEIDDTNDTDAGDYEEDSNASSSSNIEDDYYNDKNFDIEVYHRRRDDAENQCCWVEKQEWSGIDSSVCLEDGIDSDMNDNDCDSPEQKFGHFTESEIINRIDQLSRMKLQVDSRPLSQTVMIVNTMILLDPFFND